MTAEMTASEPAGRVRRRFEVTGVVQGVGFRPFVYVAAAELALTGSVLNDVSGVVIEVEGDAAAVTDFGHRLRRNAPPLAVVEAVRESDHPPVGGTEFTISESTSAGTGRTFASPDVSMCPDCDRELRDPADRRFRHPFITCTNCGPRLRLVCKDGAEHVGSTALARAWALLAGGSIGDAQPPARGCGPTDRDLCRRTSWHGGCQHRARRYACGRPTDRRTAAEDMLT